MQPTRSLGAAVRVPPLPSLRSATFLVIGGLAGLLLWEVWARVITPALIGGPLEPAGLVISLSERLFQYELDYSTATLIHWIIGIVGYPALYYFISRSVQRYGIALEALVITFFSLFLAFRLLEGTATMAMLYFWLVVIAVAGTRYFNPNPLIANALSWGTFTWFNALGIMAPIAGLPFLLMDWGGQLSFMSYVGHAIFGFVLAVTYEVLERRANTPSTYRD